MTPSALITAIVRTYTGEHGVTVQIDPPGFRADGQWFAYLMIVDKYIGNTPRDSLAAGRGPGLDEALVSLARMVRVEVISDSIVDSIAAGQSCPCGTDREDHDNVCGACSGTGLGPPCDVCQGTGHT